MYTAFSIAGTGFLGPLVMETEHYRVSHDLADLTSVDPLGNFAQQLQLQTAVV